MDEAKKNPECGRSKEQCSPARIVSGKESLKSLGNQGRIYGEGWGMFFSKANNFDSFQKTLDTDSHLHLDST